MADQTETAGARESVIDFAARVVHEVVSKELGTTPDTVPHPTDVVAVRELGRRGLLVPVELWDDRAREATPLLRHAAALAARSGKKRTAEWLTACATLPPAEWPPAPAYKGPVVPAAEHVQLGARLDAARLNAADAERIANGLRAERDLLLWLHAEALWQRDVLRIDFNSSEEDLTDARRDLAEVRAKLAASDEAGLGWHRQWLATRQTVADRQARIDKALDLANNPARWLGIEDEFAEAIREALQGGQPAEATSPSAVDSGEHVMADGTRFKIWHCPAHLTGSVKWFGPTAHCMEDGCDHHSEEPPAPFVPAADAFPEEVPGDRA